MEKEYYEGNRGLIMSQIVSSEASKVKMAAEELKVEILQTKNEKESNLTHHERSVHVKHAESKSVVGQIFFPLPSALNLEFSQGWGRGEGFLGCLMLSPNLWSKFFSFTKPSGT